MSLLSAIKREEQKLETQLNRIHHQLKSLRKAARALGRSAGGQVTRFQKRKLSAAARAKISKAAKKRWARFRAQARQKLAAD